MFVVVDACIIVMTVVGPNETSSSSCWVRRIGGFTLLFHVERSATGKLVRDSARVCNGCAACALMLLQLYSTPAPRPNSLNFSWTWTPLESPERAYTQGLYVHAVVAGSSKRNGWFVFEGKAIYHSAFMPQAPPIPVRHAHALKFTFTICIANAQAGR